MKSIEKTKNVNWDDNAEFYNMMAMMELPYTHAQLDCLGIEKTNSLLDIGCGPGRISTLSAMRAERVTSIDSSEKMLGFLKENAKRMNLENITPILLDWYDVVPGKNLRKHDFVVASRTQAMMDVDKLSALANKCVAIVIWANAPSIPEITATLFKGVIPDRPSPHNAKDRANGYNQFFNRVYNAGYDPNIKILPDGFTKDFTSREEAYAYLWKLEDSAPVDKMAIFRSNIDKYLTENRKGTFTFRIETRSCVIWWKPEKGQVISE